MPTRSPTLWRVSRSWAPHVFVEDETVVAIRDVHTLYANGGLRDKLKAYHDDVDSAFYGWNDAWLTPAFREWDITAELTSIRRPLLAIQGHGDEYASMLQIDKIKAAVSHKQLLKLSDCEHSPHRNAAGAVNDAIAAFFGNCLALDAQISLAQGGAAMHPKARLEPRRRPISHFQAIDRTLAVRRCIARARIRIGADVAGIKMPEARA